MNQNSNSALPMLLDDVRTALKNWHGDANETSSLHYLFLFRHLQRERVAQGQYGDRGVTNHLLRSAITQLALSHDTEAEFLQYRFLDLWSIQRLANHYNTAESTVYNLQSRAIERLTETLQRMELEASAEKKRLLTGRLEPSSYVNMIGVDGFAEQIEELLTRNEAPWLIALEGIGGIGKTALADYVLRRLIQQGQSDEVGWVTARQFYFNFGGAIRTMAEPALTATMLIEKLATQLMPELVLSTQLSPEGLLRALRTRLKTIPHLIVVDNLETVADVESLLPTLQSLSEPSKFVLTSRESLRIALNIFHVQLAELPTSDALALVRQEALLSNLPLLAACTDAELIPVIETVGGNPLALRLVVGQTHIYTLESIIQDLRKARGNTIENFYTFIYRRAWESLDAMTKQVFLAMPLAQPAGESLAFLAETCEMEIGQVRIALNKLVLQNLVDARGGLHERRYTIHSLTRTFLQNDIGKW